MVLKFHQEPVSLGAGMLKNLPITGNRMGRPSTDPAKDATSGNGDILDLPIYFGANRTH
jgi:hypothetical protein